MVTNKVPWLEMGVFRFRCEPSVNNYQVSSEYSRTISLKISAREDKVVDYRACAEQTVHPAGAALQGWEQSASLQAWQALVRAQTLRDPMSLMNQLLDPRFTSSDPNSICVSANGTQTSVKQHMERESQMRSEEASIPATSHLWTCGTI